ncbi:MAG: hypothetical protein WDO70_09255 [Alphaproteobacteria bacterium]
MTQDFSEAGFDAQLQVEFRDQAADRLAKINATINAAKAKQIPDEPALLALYRDIQGLKGTAAGYGFPVVNMVAQRMEGYLQGLAAFQPRTLDDLQAYADLLVTLAERAIQPDPEEAKQLIQDLPTRYDFNVGDVVVKHIEIMVVTPTRVAAKLVGGELAACGFRPVLMHDPIEALAQAVRVVPGMIIASIVMEPINGVELVRALKIMRPTRACPMAVMTSLEADRKPLHDLPADVAIIHTGPNFSDDFAAATGKFGLG